MSQPIVSGWADPKLKRLKYQRKFCAFGITTAAAFMLMMFGWSWTIKGHQSDTRIPIRLVGAQASTPEFQSLLANAVRTRTTDAYLNQILGSVKEEVPVQSRVLQSNLDELRKALFVKVLNDDQSSRLNIQLSLVGRGSRDEQLFLSRFTITLSETLAELALQAPQNVQFVVENSRSLRDHERLEQFEASLVQLQRQLDNANEICRNVLLGNDRSPFRNASHSSRAGELSIHDIQQTLSEIDLDYLRNSIAELRSSLSSPTGSAPGEFEIRSVSIGCPQPKQLWILLVLSTAAGLFIANHFQPFANRGFSGIAAVANALKVPVVATLPNNRLRQTETVADLENDRKVPWANRIAHYATAIVIGFGLLTTGFSWIDSDVRESLFNNPVDGLARILDYFRGR